MERVEPLEFTRPEGIPNVEIEDEPSPVDGYVLVRPVDRWARELFSAGPGRWFRTGARYEKDGVMRTRIPESTTIYGDHDQAARMLAEMDDTGTGVVAAVPKLLEAEELLEADRDVRRPRSRF